MDGLDTLMWKREYIPIEIMECRRRDNTMFYDISPVSLPPFHPSMEKEGIDIDLAFSVAGGAVEDTLRDIEPHAGKIRLFKRVLDEISEEIESAGRISFSAPSQDGLGKRIKPFPMIGALYIGKNMINPIGYGADHNISINGIRPGYFLVPNEMNLPEELINEYKLKCESPGALTRKIVDCPCCWYSHNVSDFNRVFYKNLVMRINNAVVKRKYSK